MREVVSRILSCPFRGSAELLAQVPHLNVVGEAVAVALREAAEDVASPLTVVHIPLTVDVTAAPPAPFARTERWPVPVRASVPPLQHLSVIVDHGYTRELVQHWLGTGEPPLLPPAADIEVETQRPWHVDPALVEAPGYGEDGGQTRWVKLMVEYSIDLPLWSNFELSEAGLPLDLLDDLADWQLDFEVNFGWEEGWRSDSARLRWASRAPSFEERLRRSLAGDIELRTDLWPPK